MTFSDVLYWLFKGYFSIFWVIWLISLAYKWDGNLMWNVSGIFSLVFFIINLRWQMSQPSSVR
jgi:hypothetical protein